MATGAPTGLQVLDREAKPVHWWTWTLGFVVALLGGVGAYLLIQRVETNEGIQQLATEEWLVAAAFGLLAAAAGLAFLAFAAVGRYVRSAAVSRQQRTMLDAIIANVPDAVVVADGRGRFRANAAAVRLFGLSTDSGRWLAFHEAMAKLDRRDLASGLRIPAESGVLEAALKGRHAAGDEVLTTPEGKLTVHVTGSPIPMAHGQWGGLILASDVTQRLAIQAALQEAKDTLQHKNAEHLQMARAIAHDLGNALTPATLHLGILQMGKGDPKPSVQALSRSVAQMQRLVGDLSDMARFQAGAMNVSVQKVALHEAIASAVTSHRPVAEGKPVALEAAVPGAVWVQADPERLGQVLSNLLSNALKFTPPQGTIRVAAQPQGALVRVSVTDSGMGLDASQMARLFKPFSQVHDPSKVKERGTGLGLYICKGLIEKQGGQMGVTSPGPGKGSTFWFTLPLAA